MKVRLRDVRLPEFGESDQQPEIPLRLHEERCRRAHKAAGVDWLVVYGDREHYANLMYLIGFDPRFEEAVLILGAGDRRILLVGNEGVAYAELLPLPLDLALCQSFSLMGQDRSRAPRLVDVVREAGVGNGDRVGVVGWKYLEPEETFAELPSFFAPAVLIDALRHIVDDDAAVVDAGAVLMHSGSGLRARNEVEQIAAFEWAASRASCAVLRIVRGIRAGMSEMEAVAGMGYMGDLLATHVLFASGTGAIVGLRSPGTRRIAQGDGVSTAVAFWGGLTARAGRVIDADPAFLDRVVFPYYKAVATWYRTMAIGIAGGTIHERTVAALAASELRPALNPGHLTSFDEWLHSPIRPESAEEIASGMMFQCDIIPTPLGSGDAINCEDTLAVGDAPLRAALRDRYPATWARIEARQTFMRDELGIGIADDILPLSNMPAYLPPLWLAPTQVCVLD